MVNKGDIRDMESGYGAVQQRGLAPDFEQLYIDARRKEQRIYTDEQVALLPGIDAKHPHSKEWKLRKRSAKRLINYLKHKQKYLRVLEVGCGNGWLSAQIAEIGQTDVTGIDVNVTELEQAKRVFRGKNLDFVAGSIQKGCLQGTKFDIIVFAASFQYFPSLPGIIGTAFSLLAVGGEVHILDTNFYSKGEAVAASQRTQGYYSSIGFPELSAHYFHHSMDDLSNFNYEIMFKPNKLKNKLLGNNSPFYWVCIKQ